MNRVVFYTQPGCLSCELMRVYLDAREIAFEERDITVDPENRRSMTEQYGSKETPTLVILSGDVSEVLTGFDPVRLDQVLEPASSSDAVRES